MVIWSTCAALVLSALTLALFRDSAPDWATTGAEVVAVVAVFVLVCLFESGAPEGSDDPGPPA
jgi:hypothetical protein